MVKTQDPTLAVADAVAPGEAVALPTRRGRRVGRDGPARHGGEGGRVAGRGGGAGMYVHQPMREL